MWQTFGLLLLFISTLSDCFTTTLPVRHILNDPSKVNFILASSSPRRRELVERNLGISGFSVVASKFNEDLDKKKFRSSADYCLATAHAKGLEVAERGDFSRDVLQILLSADTIVVKGCHEEVLEKPKDRDHAISMLSQLSNKQHTVHTAVSLFLKRKGSPWKCETQFVESTQVKFCELSKEDIDAYVATQEPYDKAGAYGVQLLGSQLVRYIAGDYYSVMGLPVSRVAKALADIVEENFL